MKVYNLDSIRKTINRASRVRVRNGRISTAASHFPDSGSAGRTLRNATDATKKFFPQIADEELPKFPSTSADHLTLVQCTSRFMDAVTRRGAGDQPATIQNVK